MSSQRGSKTTRHAADLSEIEQRALNLRIAGKTLREIGDALDMTVPGARKVILRALKRSDEAMAKQGAKHRELEAQRLNAMMAHLWDLAMGGVHVTPKIGADGSVRKTAEEASVEAQNKAVDRILRIMERRAKLLGLDAPTKTELTGKDGGPVATTAQVVVLPPLDDNSSEDATGPVAAKSWTSNPLLEFASR